MLVPVLRVDAEHAEDLAEEKCVAAVIEEETNLRVTVERIAELEGKIGDLRQVGKIAVPLRPGGMTEKGGLLRGVRIIGCLLQVEDTTERTVVMVEEVAVVVTVGENVALRRSTGKINEGAERTAATIGAMETTDVLRGADIETKKYPFWLAYTMR